jgi:predicted AAA+ superfamily ATPase
VLARRDPSRRRAWVRDYTRAIVARDVRDIAEIAHLDEVPRLLAALAHQAGQLINYADLAGKLGLDAKTARRYLGILEQVYLVRRIEPWSANRLKRLIKTPKLHFVDTAVLAGLRGVRTDNLLADRTSWGALLETFVVSEGHNSSLPVTRISLKSTSSAAPFGPALSAVPVSALWR